MKEIQQHHDDKLKVAEERQVIKSTDHKNVRRIPGLTMYEFDIKNACIRVAEYDKVFHELDGSVRKKLLMKPLHLYCQALNFKSAEKKFIKLVDKMINFIS